MDRVTNISWKTTSGATLGGFGYEYDTAGRLASTLSLSTRSTRSTRLNAWLYLYDNLNERVAAVDDRNFNNTIDWTGPDLISSNLTHYVKLDGYWWRETKSYSIHDDNSAVARLMGVRRSRVTGLGANGLASESISIDQRGNATTNRVWRNRAAAEEVAWVKYPTSNTPAVTTSTNGLVRSSVSQTGVRTAFAYDAFQREVAQTDGRGNVTGGKGGKGSELIDTQALTHLACLWYSVNHEEDKDNRALLVLSSDEPAGTSGVFSR